MGIDSPICYKHKLTKHYAMNQDLSKRINTSAISVYVGPPTLCNFNHVSGSSTLISGSRTGQSVPNFKSKIRNHQNATSNYEYKALTRYSQRPLVFTEDIGKQACGLDATNVVRPRRTTALCNPNFTVPSSFPTLRTELRNRAIARVYNKIDTREARINSLVPLIEMKELRGSVKSLAGLVESRLTYLISILKRIVSRPKQASAFLANNVAEQYLTFHFGISPLVTDVAHAAEAFANQLDDYQHKPYKVVAYERDQWLTSKKGSTGASAVPIGHNCSYYQRLEHELLYKLTVGVLPILESSTDFKAFATQFGVSLPSVPSAIWEIIPYSWMVDYFFNIGSLLNTNLRSDVNPYYVVESSRYTIKINTDFNEPFSGGPPRHLIGIEQPGNFSGEYVWYKRQSLGLNIPLQTLWFKSPSDWFATSRLASLVSVLAIQNAQLRANASYYDNVIKRHRRRHRRQTA